MILNKRIALNGNQMDEVHEMLVIKSIDVQAPHESFQTMSRGGGVGQRMASQHWDYKEVTVTYGIDVQKREMAIRKEIYDAVTAWAMQMGWLTVNYNPGKRMFVDKIVLPSEGSMWEWLSEYPITFRANNVPFWQDETPTTAVSALDRTGQIGLEVTGNTQTVVNAKWKNQSGMTVNNIQITAGGKAIQLSNLGLSGNGTLEISHGNDGLLRITADGVSAYAKYTGDDDLIVNPGRVQIGFSADRAGILTASCYGRYI